MDIVVSRGGAKVPKGEHLCVPWGLRYYC